ncbi:hypothetical protein [uncultured Ruegeria sp.]|uniref:hypothetical protein n=1 Tax=uncultured Ruegeria sp. TaxID=259304 RepID=UPI0026249B7D|nr:hypothetical protein [uncultured Ruegeria sp.]
MATAAKKTTVKGGYIVRDAKTGRFTEVKSSSGVKKPGFKSVSAVKEASKKRHSALKRLADR